MATVYSIKPPDMSRNMALAGKTVSSRGMNITYDEDGYAVSAQNYNHKHFANTEKSIAAPNIDTVLSTADRGSYGGSVYDQQHFSDKELAGAANLRDQLSRGAIDRRTADFFIEEIRAKYGYSGGGANGTGYAALTFPKPEEESESRQTYAVAPIGEDELKESYQEKLKQQQERQNILRELQDAQTASLSSAMAQKADSILSAKLFDDDKDEK